MAGIKKDVVADMARPVKPRTTQPVAEYLKSLPEWDGKPRMETLLIDYLGAEDSDYVRTVTRRTLAAAAGRAVAPALSLNCTPVLCGPHGVGKSTLIKKLGGKWYNNSISARDALAEDIGRELQGSWLVEISDLTGLSRAEAEALRIFMSYEFDGYHESPRGEEKWRGRRCVLIGTTNERSSYLELDEALYAPFCLVETPGRADRHPWELTQHDVDQIWAEAYNYIEESGVRMAGRAF